MDPETGRIKLGWELFAGGAAGGVVGIALLLGLGFWYRKRRTGGSGPRIEIELDIAKGAAENDQVVQSLLGTSSIASPVPLNASIVSPLPLNYIDPSRLYVRAVLNSYFIL